MIKNLLAPFNWPIKLVEKISKFLAAVSYGLLCSTSIFLLASAIVTSQMVQSKGLAVTIMGFGAFFSAMLLGFYLPKFFDAQRQKAENDCDREQRLAADLRIKCENYEQERARLERSWVNLDAFQMINELTLLRLKLKQTDTENKLLKVEEPVVGGYVRNERRHRYIGVVTVPITVDIGIDLASVRILREESGRLVVSNIRSRVNGPHVGKPDRFLDEVRIENIANEKVSEVEIDPNDPRRVEERDLHEAKLHTEICNRLNLGQYEEGVIKAAENVLRPFLTPLGTDVIFQDKGPETGLPLFDFVKSHNRQISEKITAIRKGMGFDGI
jgi:hypothetical protein